MNIVNDRPHLMIHNRYSVQVAAGDCTVVLLLLKLLWSGPESTHSPVLSSKRALLDEILQAGQR